MKNAKVSFIKTLGLSGSVAMAVAMAGCADEPMTAGHADSSRECRATAPTSRAGAADDQTAWRDIRGFDPSLPGQSVEVELPVSCGGAETSVTARLSIMPMHVYEENGPDRLGDYYVVEADFTAHNGPMWEKGMFMKSLDVEVTPTDKQGKPIAGIAFHDNPTPATTVANQTFRASTTAGVRGGAAMGVALPHVVYVAQGPGLGVLRLDPYFPENTNGTLVIMDNGMHTEISCKDVYTVDFGGRKCFFFKTQGYDKRLYAVSDGGITNMGEPGRFYYSCFKMGQDGNPVVDSDNNPIFKEYETLPEGNIRETVGEDGPRIIEYEYGTPPGEDIPVLVPAKFYCALGIACGCSWSKEQSIRLEDVTTSLRTGVDASVEYLYTVENYDSGRGIPELARGDFHGHATWVWRMPVHASVLTVEELAASLFDVHIEIAPVYASVKDTGKDLLPDDSVGGQHHIFPLEPPMRGHTVAVEVDNPTSAPVGAIKVLSMPYDRWVDGGCKVAAVLASYDGIVAGGGKVSVLVPDTDCYLVLEELDPRTLKSKGLRQSGRITVRMDACNPHTQILSTIDTTPLKIS